MSLGKQGCLAVESAAAVSAKHPGFQTLILSSFSRAKVEASCFIRKESWNIWMACHMHRYLSELWVLALRLAPWRLGTLLCAHPLPMGCASV